MVLTASPTWNPSPPGPTAATVPAASYPMRAGKSGCSMYSPLRNIDSARLSPSALTRIWTSPFPGGGTSRCSIFRTSGPPVSRELPDHRRPRLGVRRGDARHDRGVGNAQALDAADAQLGVDHRFPARSHRAGADRAEIGGTRPTQERLALLPAHSPGWNDPALDQVAERRLGGDLLSKLDAGHEGVDIDALRQEVGLDIQRGVGLCGPQPQIPLCSAVARAPARC